jgi:UbiD family decarboxylase
VTTTKKAGRPARNLRDFLAALAEAEPDSILRVKEPVALDYEMTAIAMELERRGQSPVLWFERVGDSPFPVIANIFGNRRRFAFAAGVPEPELPFRRGRRPLHHQRHRSCEGSRHRRAQRQFPPHAAQGT